MDHAYEIVIIALLWFIWTGATPRQVWRQLVGLATLVSVLATCIGAGLYVANLDWGRNNGTVLGWFAGFGVAGAWAMVNHWWTVRTLGLPHDPLLTRLRRWWSKASPFRPLAVRPLRPGEYPGLLVWLWRRLRTPR